jgi:F0F1-type ATP synthase membrane subunit b/b'
MSFNFNILLAAADGTPWWNIPGLELWKIVNLLLFVGLMVYILRRPVSEMLRTRREGIRRDLMRAQEERDAALAKLEEVNERLARLDAEVETIRAQAEREAADERQRIERSTEEEIRKLSEQAQREIEGASKVARMELRRFAAGESVRLAEEMLRRDLRPEDDARLVREYVDNLGGIKH